MTAAEHTERILALPIARDTGTQKIVENGRKKTFVVYSINGRTCRMRFNKVAGNPKNGRMIGRIQVGNSWTVREFEPI